MSSAKQTLPSYKRKRQGNDKPKTSRPKYLQALVEEYKTTDNQEAKRQVLANLANFAYDPCNYQWLRELNVIQLFLDAITNEVTTGTTVIDDFKTFGIGGLCNLVLDPGYSHDLLFSKDTLTIICNCLNSLQPDIVCSALTTLLQLLSLNNIPSTAVIIIKEKSTTHLDQLIHSTNRCISNLAILLKEHLV
ncbi:hypothetical protein BDF19DRAFT_410815 [Syncephalis fuscata]|nr:hypothetical protein BDF19DRAFT_410815 [Syncephalis fuscata]